MASGNKRLSCSDYHVAWICGLADLEFLPARLMLDEEHPTPPYDTHYDENVYICGTINGHAVVIATFPQGDTGSVNAGSLTRPLFKTFPNIRMAVLVGIGGGIPRADVSDDAFENLHLGDVVVGWPSDGKPACVYYDRRKSKVNEQFEPVGTMQNPHWRLTDALRILKSDYELGKTKFDDQLVRLQRFKRKFTIPGVEQDKLYKAKYHHVGEYRSKCFACDETELINRPERAKEDRNTIVFHYGRIATSNAVIQDGEVRDNISARCSGALCIETEAAGVDANRRCLVIRGISDYADSHRNDVWRSYAAGTAAAFTRGLLCRLQPGAVELMKLDADMELTTAEKGIQIDRLLSPSDPSTSYRKAFSRHHYDNGLWFLHGNAFRTWSTMRSSFLWLYDTAGNMTVLASSIVEHLTNHLRNPLLYFYFDPDDAGKQSLESLVRSLLSQLYHTCGGASNSLDELIDRWIQGRGQPSCESLCKVFLQMIEHLKEVWIVLVGIDVCRSVLTEYPAEDLPAWMRDLHTSDQINVHLLVTGHTKLESRLGDLIFQEDIVCVSTDSNSDYIRGYIRFRIIEDEGLKRWLEDPEMQNRIESDFTQKLSGVRGDLLHNSGENMQDSTLKMNRIRWIVTMIDVSRENPVSESLEMLLNPLRNTVGKSGSSHNQKDYSLSVSDTLPSLTTGQTGQTAQSVTMDPRYNELTINDLNDRDSQVSDLRGVTPEDRDRIASGFADAISRRIQTLFIKFSSVPISQKRLQNVFASKLKQFAKDVVTDTPSTIEYQRKRNAAKTIFWHRNDVAAQAIQILVPSQHDQEPRFLGQESEPTYLDRIDLMGREPADYPPDSWASELSANRDLYAKMSYDEVVVDSSEIAEISKYLTSRKEFTILDVEFERLAQHYCSDTMGLIQKNVFQTLSKGSTDKPPTFFQANCSILTFIRGQYGADLHDLGHMLAITGNCHDAQLTTVGLYIKQTWPSYPDVFLHALQSAVFGTQQPSVEQLNISTTSENTCKISIQEGIVTAEAHGSLEFRYTIGQQLAWFGAVCRDSEGGLVYCDTVCETKQEQRKRDGADFYFSFSYNLSSFDKDEIKPCWHRLIGNMVVATGFPIPNRPNEEPGLQIPIEIMATLGHVLVADDFGSGIVLKGDAFDFVPVIRNGDHVQWHLVDSAKNALETYENLTGHSRLSLEKFGGEALSNTTAFLGWTRYITNNSGTEKIDYTKIQWARASQTPELSVSFSGFSFSLTKIFGSTATFAVGQKQYAQEVQELDNYDEIIRDLRDRSVILYDTHTHRGWLIDAARATLQIILHRYKSREGGRGINLRLTNDDFDIHSVMIKNREAKLWEDWDSTKNEKKDILFAAEVKKIREKLIELATKAQAEYKRVNSSKKVVGFEYRGMVETPENLDALTVKLDSTCGEWPHVAHRQLYTTILFGFNFQEIMVPTNATGLCLRYRTMPSKRSYLAAETKIIHDIILRTSLSLVSTDSLFPTCKHPADDKIYCSCRRVQAIKVDTARNSKLQLDRGFLSGAIIIGERIIKQLSRSKSPDRDPVVTSVLADTTSNLAQLVISSADNSHSRVECAEISSGRRLGSQPSSLEPSHLQVKRVEATSSAFSATRSHWEKVQHNQSRGAGNE